MAFHAEKYHTVSAGGIPLSGAQAVPSAGIDCEFQRLACTVGALSDVTRSLTDRLQRASAGMVEVGNSVRGVAEPAPAASELCAIVRNHAQAVESYVDILQDLFNRLTI